MKGAVMEQCERVLCALGIRGILTTLGVRKTVASGDMILPDKKLLIKNFCKPIAELTEEEKMKRKVVEKLTVGARALMKHAHRSSEGFWSSGTGSEAEHNQRARTVMNQIMDNCIWVNIHSLPHDEYMVEVLFPLLSSAEYRRGTE